MSTSQATRQARHQARAQEIEAKLKALTPGQGEVAMSQLWAFTNALARLGETITAQEIQQAQENALAYAATRSRG